VSSLVKSRIDYFEAVDDTPPMPSVASDGVETSYVASTVRKFDGSSLAKGEFTTESTMESTVESIVESTVESITESTVESTLEVAVERKKTVREVLKVITEETGLEREDVKHLPGGDTAIFWGHLDRTCDVVTFENLFKLLFNAATLEDLFLREEEEIPDMLVNIIVESGYSGWRLPKFFRDRQLEPNADPKVAEGWEKMLKRVVTARPVFRKDRFARILRERNTMLPVITETH